MLCNHLVRILFDIPHDKCLAGQAVQLADNTKDFLYLFAGYKIVQRVGVFRDRLGDAAQRHTAGFMPPPLGKSQIYSSDASVPVPVVDFFTGFRDFNELHEQVLHKLFGNVLTQRYSCQEGMQFCSGAIQ